MRQQLLIVMTKPPMASSANQEALDLALAAASFDQDVTLVFEDTGALQLLENQDARSVGRKDVGKMMKALPIYGIDKVYYYLSSSLLKKQTMDYGSITKINTDDYARLLDNADRVIRF